MFVCVRERTLSIFQTNGGVSFIIMHKFCSKYHHSRNTLDFLLFSFFFSLSIYLFLNDNNKLEM